MEKTRKKVLHRDFKKHCSDSMKSIVQFLKGIIFIGIAVLVWFAYEEHWLALFNKHIFPFLDIPVNGLTRCIAWIFILAILIQLARNYLNKYRISTCHWIILTAILCIYARYRWSEGLYQFTLFIGPIAYLDVVMLAILVYLLVDVRCFYIIHRTRKEDPLHNSNPYLMPDQPISTPNEDLLEYNIEAVRLVKILENLSLDKSWSIGITSPWGTGKTSFLNLVKQVLNSNTFITVNFNPRNSKDTRSIQEDFFTTACAALKPYNSSFSTMFRSYMEALQLFDKKDIISTLLSLGSMVDKKSAKEKLSDALEHLPKKVVIIIDDFDRLLADDIIEVFKLIDGNASFPNVIFLTAYDKKHVAKMISEKYQNEDSLFSDKFFNLEVVVPIRPYRKLHTHLSKWLLDGIRIKEEERDLYRSILDNYEKLLSKYLLTLRDVKRFLNLFIKEYVPMKEEVNFEDFFLITIIKYKDANEHRNIFQRKDISQNIDGLYFWETNDNSQFKDILEELFPEKSSTRRDNYRRINAPKAFDNYFVNQIYNMLTKEEMKLTLQKDLALAKLDMARWIREKKISDFMEFLMNKNMLTFNEKSEFTSYTQIVFYLTRMAPDTELYFLLLRFINKENATSFTTQYNFAETEYKELIKSILFGKHPEYYTMITKKFLINCIDNQYNNEHIIFTKDELLAINKENLKDYISKEPIMNKQHMNLLYACISSIDPKSRVVTLDGDSCNSVKQLIMAHPEYYLSNFVGLGSVSTNPDYNTIACEPYWEVFFGSAASFESFITQPEHDSIEHIHRTRNFWKLYKNNGFEPISFEGQGNVQDMIDNDLRQPMILFQELLKIKSDIQKLNDAARSTRNKALYIKQYERLDKRILDNGLFIKLTGDLRDEIEYEMKKLDSLVSFPS